MSDEKPKPLPWEYDTCCAIIRCDEGHPGAQRHVDGGYYAVLFEGEPAAVKLAIERVNGTPLSPSREDEARIGAYNYSMGRAAVLDGVAMVLEAGVFERDPEVWREAADRAREEAALRSTPPPPAKSEDEVRAEVWEEAGRVLPELGTGAGRDYAANKAADLRAGKEGRKGR